MTTRPAGNIWTGANAKKAALLGRAAVKIANRRGLLRKRRRGATPRID
jgi:hypothetical protein